MSCLLFLLYLLVGFFALAFIAGCICLVAIPIGGIIYTLNFDEYRVPKTNFGRYLSDRFGIDEELYLLPACGVVYCWGGPILLVALPF